MSSCLQLLTVLSGQVDGPDFCIRRYVDWSRVHGAGYAELQRRRGVSPYCKGDYISFVSLVSFSRSVFTIADKLLAVYKIKAVWLYRA